MFRQLSNTVSYTRSKIREHGIIGGIQNTTVTIASEAYVSVLGNPGESIWERDWDILLILDACRTDLMSEVAQEYSFIRDVGHHRSIASKSPDWIRRTFSEEYADEVTRTAYVSGNPFTAKVEMTASPAILDEVWKYKWDHDLSTIPARPITDRAIDTWRNDNPDRMIVHYMQPHVPFVPHPDIGEYGSPEDFGNGFDEIWHQIGNDITEKEFWNAYRDNLRYVLDDVCLLLESVNADTVVLSADHGNAIGEWSVFGHPSDNLLSVIRDVPWVEVEAKDTTSYTPTTDQIGKDHDSGVNQRLRDLGYLE